MTISQKITLVFSCCISLSFHAQTVNYLWQNDIYECDSKDNLSCLKFVNNQTIVAQSWDELAQPLFWKKIMLLPPDSCVINIGSTRQIVQVFSVKDWEGKSDEQKTFYRDSVRKSNQLLDDEHIYMTRGKNDFYRFDQVIPTITRGVEVFSEQGVDPWYAQSILLIESPGALAKSTVGAYGPFQLMKGVAINMGLTVNGYTDDRKDFDKSAQAASRLINTICIPEAKRILDQESISYNTTDLWFRLFVLHIYHAGAGNVQKVVKAIAPTQGGQDLITKMWQTKAGGFGNASQNYSQIALASLIVLNETINNAN